MYQYFQRSLYRNSGLLVLERLNEQRGSYDSYSELQHQERKYKASQERNGLHTSYTALPGSFLFISTIPTPVPSGDLLLPVGLTSVEDVEVLVLRARRISSKASFSVPDRLLLSSPPASPASVPGSEVLPRKPLVKSTRRSFKS